MKTIKKVLSVALCFIMLAAFAVPAFAAGEVIDTSAVNNAAPTASDEIAAAFENPNGKILSVAKNCNPRLFPASSIEGIRSCIDLKVDIVSVTVQKTKDDQLVLLLGTDLKNWCVNKSDNTSASGKISEFTLEQLKASFNLREGNGGTDAKPTKYAIASLAEAIEACKGNIMLMVDNGFKYATEINTLARSLDACNIVILRGAKSDGDISAFTAQAGTPTCHIAAVYTGDTSGSAKTFVTATLSSGAKMVELSAKKSYSSIFNQSVISKFQNSGRAFISTTDPALCGGRLDLIEGWTELIDKGYSVIETDYPKELASYIEEIESYRTELSTLISKAQALSLSKYTKDSASSLTSSLEEAEKVSAVGCISLGEIDKARYDIQESLDNLTLKAEGETSSLPVWAIILIVVASIIVLLILVVLGLRLYNKIKAKERKMNKFKDNFKNRAPAANDNLTSISGEEAPLSDIEAQLAEKEAKAATKIFELEKAIQTAEGSSEEDEPANSEDEDNTSDDE